ncbi:hypothetical protein ACH5RR_035588 [Cinchona calisaya]|uniref:Protein DETOXIFICATION n=1 Tax=Cinchona calisaya TaxID=153742 RepID=A0ABD2Y5P7_9GENT
MEDYEQPLLFNSNYCHDPMNQENNNYLISQREPCSIPSISLNETEISPINHGNISTADFLKEFYIELKKVWYLAGPSIFTSVCQYGLGAFTQIFAGQLGTVQLATISVENSVIAGFGYGILSGLGSALETLCGQAYGAKQYGMLGIYMQRSWFILNTVALPITFLFIFGTQVLKFLGQTPTISKEAGKFAMWMIPQQFAYAMMIPLTKFLQAQSRVMEMAIIAAIALCVHAFLGWFLILNLGWGLPGAALVLNGSWWFIALAQFLYVMAGSCGVAWPGFSWKALTNLSGFLKLSISSALMECLGMWQLMAVVLLAGHLKNAEVTVAALSICINILGWASMVGSGFNAAISVRVSNELGSGRSRAAKFSVMVVGVISTLFGLLFAFVLLLQRKQYPTLFSTDNEVKHLVYELTPYLGLSIIFACLPLNGVAAGAGWQNFVAYMNLGCYFIFGTPFGILMCYKFDMGVKGLWYGMLLGVFLQTIAVLLVISLANWKKEAYAAQERLKQLGGETQAQLPDDEN